MKELKEVLHYYLPYKVKIIISHRNQPDFEGNLTLPYLADCTGVKLILRPLSKFNTGQFNHDQVREIVELREGNRTIGSMHFSTVELCLENHLDIFGLIKSGQAIEK